MRLERSRLLGLSAGAGSKGDRDYDWAWIATTAPDGEAAGHHWLLIRRRISDGELAFYRCWSRVLTVIATRERHQHTGNQKLMALTFNEIRRLFAKLIANTIHPISHWLSRSTWRRQHQARARTSHYRRRGRIGAHQGWMNGRRPRSLITV